MLMRKVLLLVPGLGDLVGNHIVMWIKREVRVTKTHIL